MRPARGFTLIELMIVVAIIAILVAIALPGLLQAKLAGNERSIAGSLKSVANGQETASNTLFVGSYWALDVIGLYFVEPVQSPTDVEDDFAKFVTDAALGQADLARGAAVAPNPAYGWEYDTSARETVVYRGKSGYVLRGHSAFTASLVQGTGPSYGVVACPMRLNRSGTHCYIVDEEATVYRRVWNGAATIRPDDEDAALLQGGFMVTWPSSAEKGANWMSSGS